MLIKKDIRSIIIESSKETLGITDFLSSAKEYTSEVFEGINLNELFSDLSKSKFSTSSIKSKILKIFSSTQYESARYYIPMLTIGAVASAMSLMYGTIVTARGKTKVAAVITIVGAILSVVLDIILLRFWGIWAAAFVSMFSFIFLCYGNMLYAHVKVDHVRPLFGVFFASLSMYMMTFIVHVDTIVVSFIVKLLIIIISCFVIMLVLGLNIKKLIKSLINKS